MVRGLAGAVGEGAEETVRGLLEGLGHRGGDTDTWSGGDVVLGVVGDDVSVSEGGVSHETAEGFGGFARVSVEGEEVVLERDFLGAKPLFYAEEEGFVFCSERRALWEAGFRGVERVPQGGSLVFDGEGVSVEEGRGFEARELHGEYGSVLVEELEGSVERLVEGVDEVGVAFSGGLDSSTTAVLLDERVDVTLFNVGLEGSQDVEWAGEAAELLGMELVQRTLGKEEVFDAVDDAILTVGDADRMKVGVAIPLMLTADLMRGEGFDVAFAGQGSDELLGGYARHRRSEDPEGEIRRELGRMGRRNLERDEHVFSSRRIDIRCPFLTGPVVETALGIPAGEKIGELGGVELGKLPLRRGMEGRLPDPIRLRPKKAVQYGTLVDRELDRLARRSGFKRRIGRHVQKFLNHRAEEIGLPGEAMVSVE